MAKISKVEIRAHSVGTKINLKRAYMSREQVISQKLNRHPLLKKIIKRVYQRGMYAISNKKRSEGNIERVSPDDSNHEYFFGYYDKTPEDATGRYILCLKTKDTWSSVAPKEPAQILLIDRTKSENDPERVEIIAETHAWNVQQGCMLQWLGPHFDKKIIFNDFREGKYVSVIKDVFCGEERLLSMPVYSVSSDGTFALSLDFSRLHRFRPGYGYSNIPDGTAGKRIPEETAIWKINLNNNDVIPLLSYKDFSNFEPRHEMKNAEHKVNHIMISPNGKRFMVLHRWFDGSRKYSRLVTVNVDGTDMYNLSDDDMVSHCFWKNDQEIIAFENKKEFGVGYYLMMDKTHDFRKLWKHINSDGHPSYSPDGRLMLTDTYPNRQRMATVKILSEDFNIDIASVFAPFKYDNDTRCDLHPRWSRDGLSIYFDSVFEGFRGLYAIDIRNVPIAYHEIIGQKIQDKSNDKKSVLFIMTSCRKSGPTQVIMNIIQNLDQSKFEAILITLYNEEISSQMDKILPFVTAHYFVKTTKKEIVTGKTQELSNILAQINPDVIHTTGVFPDYVISRIMPEKQVMTLHNYVYDDYPAKFGKIRGNVLARLQISAMHRAKRIVACSESLSNIYGEKLRISAGYIRNGIDIDLYSEAGEDEKRQLRDKLNIPQDFFVFIYTGQFIQRKNVPFLLEGFNEYIEDSSNTCLILLGDGAKRAELQNQYKSKRIDFRGSVDNVNEYLKACDAYISSSKSEGLPNGVLEAMSSGIPVLLSDIEQHAEILKYNPKAGFLYTQNDIESFKQGLKKLANNEYIGKEARKVVE